MASGTVESLCQQARQAVAERDYNQARQLYLQALGFDPDDADVHYGLATVYFLLSDLESAAHHFKQVNRIDPHRAGAYINLGAVHNRLGRFDEAAERGPGTPTETAREAAPSLDPERVVDPTKHGPLLTVLHNATIDCDSHARHFVEMLEKDIEPAIKELSACLLIADSPLSEL